MELVPIIAALRRNKVGALLIGLQIALTLAIVCNSLSLIQQRLQRMQRPCGIDEANIFTFSNLFIGQPSDLSARIQEDLAALRSLPDVVDVIATQSYPLHGGGRLAQLMLTPEQKEGTAKAAEYLVDEHGLAAFGTRLVAGRWFKAEEVRDFQKTDIDLPPVMIVTSALAKNLFPDGDALGKNVYLFSTKASVRIVGIVDRFQTPWAASSWGEQFIENSALVPYRWINSELSYVVRTRKGQRDSVMRVVPAKLFELSRARVIDNIRPFSDTRAGAYHGDRALSIILGVVSVLLLTVTACGIVGLTTYWVAQRRRQIGVRRALGARRVDIMRYFHTENLLIAGAGGALGIALGLAGNLWLATTLELTRMSVGFIVLGAAIVFALSQIAVIWPALRAASIPPAIAARGA